MSREEIELAIIELKKAMADMWRKDHNDPRMARMFVALTELQDSLIRYLKEAA